MAERRGRRRSLQEDGVTPGKFYQSTSWLYLTGTRFGVVYLTLQLIPVLSMFFLVTSACGSALWVADIELEKQRQAVTVAREANREGEDDSQAGQYADVDAVV